MNYLEYMKININDLIRWAGAGLAAAAAFFFGGADKWIYALIAVVILDYISGVIAAIITRKVNSRRGFAGILKKVLMFCVVGVANIVDQATGAGGVLRALTVGFLLANESISVLENCGRCGIPLPKKLLDILEQLKNAGNNAADNKDNTKK